MEPRSYRSYLIRIWAAGGDPGAGGRVTVEEVRSGRQVELRGKAAWAMRASIDAVLDGAGTARKGDARMILVVGATGLVGGEICRRLAARGWPVRALVRASSDAAKSAALDALGVEVVVGELQDRAALEAACRGVSAVITTVSAMPFSYVPGVNDLRTTDADGAMRLVDVAVAAGVEQFVYTSFSSNLEVDTPLGDAKRTVERHLVASGIAFTILRPSCFMEVWLSPAVGFDPAHGGVTVYGSGEAPVSWIAAGDVAEFAVRSLDSPAARNAALELGGPEALSPLEVVALFESLAGRHLEVTHVPLEALEAQQAAATDPMAQTFAGLMRCVALGDAIEMAPLLREIPVPLTTVGQYAQSVMGAALATVD